MFIVGGLTRMSRTPLSVHSAGYKHCTPKGVQPDVFSGQAHRPNFARALQNERTH